MRLQLFLWFVLNGSLVEPNCRRAKIRASLKLCIDGCWTKTGKIVTCIKKCLQKKATTERKCQDQKGMINVHWTFIDTFVANCGQCDQYADCVPTASGFECACKEGFVGHNGTLCTDIDECETSIHDCDTNAKCLNNQGSYDCVCKEVYQGNGTTCSSECKNEFQKLLKQS